MHAKLQALRLRANVDGGNHLRRPNDAMQGVLRCGRERALHVNAGLCGSFEKVDLDDGVGRGRGKNAVLGMNINTRYSSARSCPRARSTFRSCCMSHLLPSKTLFTVSDACCRGDEEAGRMSGHDAQMHVEIWTCKEKARHEKTRTQKGTKTRKRELNNAPVVFRSS